MLKNFRLFYLNYLQVTQTGLEYREVNTIAFIYKEKRNLKVQLLNIETCKLIDRSALKGFYLV